MSSYQITKDLVLQDSQMICISSLNVEFLIQQHVPTTKWEVYLNDVKVDYKALKNTLIYISDQSLKLQEFMNKSMNAGKYVLRPTRKASNKSHLLTQLLLPKGGSHVNYITNYVKEVS